MKFNRKLLAALMVVCLFMSNLVSASAATLNATYYEASYYDIATTAYSRMLLFQNGDGVAPAANQDKLYGLVTITGQVVTPFQYIRLEPLAPGLFAAFNSEGKEGIIDSTGKVVYDFKAGGIECRNDTLRIYEQGADGISRGNYYTLSFAPSTQEAFYGTSGSDVPAALEQYDYCYPIGDYYEVSQSGVGSGLVDSSGNVVFALGEYSNIDVCDSDGATVFLVSRWTGSEREEALLDAAKNVIVDFGTYDSIDVSYYGGSGFQVSKGDQKGLIDATGKVIVPLGNYQEIYDVNSQGYVSVVTYEGSTWSSEGVTNLSSTLYKDGQAVKTYPGKRVATRVYYRDLAFSGTDFEYNGIMDVNENVIIPAQYKTITPSGYEDDLIAWSAYDTNWERLGGLYRADGTHVFEDQYKSITYLRDGKYAVYDGAHYGVLTSTTTVAADQVVIPLKYNDLRVYTYNFIAVYDGTYYSVLDLNNQVVVPESTEEISLFNATEVNHYFERDMSKVVWYADSFDNYTNDIQPFVIQTAYGPVTVYAGYESGIRYGDVPYAASNINADGWFIYQNPWTGLYGFAQTDQAVWASGGDVLPVPSDWAKGEVDAAIQAGLVPDDLQTAYQRSISREDFCRLMVSLVEQTSGLGIDAYLASRGLTVTDPFTDTDYADVLAAYALGIVTGDSATTFNPNGPITRQEAATMLARTAKVLGLTAGAGENFADAGQFASWASEGIAFVSGLTDPTTGGKVMGGVGNNQFSPLTLYTCEQAVLTTLRLFHCAG